MVSVELAKMLESSGMVEYIATARPHALWEI